MVKNFKGGKAFKSMKKSSDANSSSSSLRLPTDEMEVFAIVSKFYGNMCDVIICTGQTYKCWIRGKFKGKSKRESLIGVGTLILVGFRHFEYPNFKYCDLLEVYEPQDVSALQRIPGILLPSLQINEKKEDNENIFEFTDEKKTSNEDWLIEYEDEEINIKDI